MDASALVEIIAETPFQPLVLRLSDGRSHVVRHPEQAVISNRVVYVVTPREGDPRIAENVAHVSIEHIVEVAPALPSS